MKNVLLSLWRLSSAADRWRFYALLVMMFLAGNLELLGIGMILPVVALLTNAEVIHQNFYLRRKKQNAAFWCMDQVRICPDMWLHNGFQQTGAKILFIKLTVVRTDSDAIHRNIIAGRGTGNQLHVP